MFRYTAICVPFRLLCNMPSASPQYVFRLSAIHLLPLRNKRCAPPQYTFRLSAIHVPPLRNKRCAPPQNAFRLSATAIHLPPLRNRNTPSASPQYTFLPSAIRLPPLCNTPSASAQYTVLFSAILRLIVRFGVFLSWMIPTWSSCDVATAAPHINHLVKTTVSVLYKNSEKWKI
jgi:hypothetical protein